VWNLHVADCMSDADIDPVELAGRTDPADPTSCVACHGWNGVFAWEDLGGDTGGGP
jgi:hypothetical protein